MHVNIGMHAWYIVLIANIERNNIMKNENQKTVIKLPVKAISQAYKRWQDAEAYAKECKEALNQKIFDTVGASNGRYDFGWGSIYDVIDETDSLRYDTKRAMEEHPEFFQQYIYDTVQARHCRRVPESWKKLHDSEISHEK